MSHVSALYHIVFSTYRRTKVINESNKEKLFRYIWGIISKKSCKLLRINSAGNHIHLLVDLNPTVPLAELVGMIKQSSSIWIKQSGLFPGFIRWSKEYYAASVSSSSKDIITEYIKQQEMHHFHKPFETEIEELLKEIGQTFYNKLDY